MLYPHATLKMKNCNVVCTLLVVVTLFNAVDSAAGLLGAGMLNMRMSNVNPSVRVQPRVNSRTRKDVTPSSVTSTWPLHAALRIGEPKLSVIKSLISSHVSEINSLDPHGSTPLMLAISRKLSLVVPLLLRAGADPNMVSQNSNSLSPLMLAISTGQHSVAQMLLEAGANVHYKLPNAFSVSAVEMAVENDDVLGVKLLMRYNPVILKSAFNHIHRDSEVKKELTYLLGSRGHSSIRSVSSDKPVKEPAIYHGFDSMKEMLDWNKEVALISDSSSEGSTDYTTSDDDNKVIRLEDYV